jgi:diguanylate cyclase (GGDEF)-like protein
VNDTLGHHVGDRLLERVGERLAGAVRSNDLVARLGGDEFGMLFREVPDAETGLGLAGRASEALESPFELGSLALRAEASVGMAVAPLHGSDSATLVRRADIALYAAKQTLHGLEAYDIETDPTSKRRLTLANDLRRAVATDAFTVAYQPKARVRSRRITGFEALARWTHPEEGTVPPIEFIPIAENTGAIAPLTYRVLGDALDQLMLWRRAGYDISIAVNVSPRMLEDESFPSRLENELTFRMVPPGALTLEITESTAMAESDRVGRVLRALDAIGVALSIDDFGTGFSSLGYLRRLPVDEVKIDRGFVKDMVINDRDETIVASTIQLMHGLGFTVVAEGVEDDATWDRLDAADCDVVQGYLIAKPMSADEATSFLETWS